MPLPELERYHREQRKIWFTQGKNFGKIHIREIFYPVFRTFLTVDRLFRRQTITTISQPPIHKERVIFAYTHIGKNAFLYFDKLIPCRENAFLFRTY